MTSSCPQCREFGFFVVATGTGGLLILTSSCPQCREFGSFVVATGTGVVNRRSSEIQGTALGKCLQAWPVWSRPAGVAQSRRAFVGGTVSTWAR